MINNIIIIIIIIITVIAITIIIRRRINFNNDLFLTRIETQRSTLQPRPENLICSQMMFQSVQYARHACTTGCSAQASHDRSVWLSAGGCLRHLSTLGGPTSGTQANAKQQA